MALTETLTETRQDFAAQNGSDITSSVATLLSRVFGAAMICACFALWIVPFAMAPALMLVKLGVSVGLLVAGLGLVTGSAQSRK